MVDETSNKIKTIWAFNPAELKEDILKILVGRDREISDLIQWLKINKGSIPEKHRLFHGPRGIGKTTLLLAVYYTILKTPNLLKAFLPVIFSEDSALLNNETNFVKAVYDFLTENADKLEIKEEFNRYKDKWTPSLDSLIEFSRIINRTLVFLLDNLQAFFGAVLEGRGGSKEAAKGPQFLEKLLKNPEFLIIACSLKVRGRIKNKKEIPFWECFEKTQLPKLKDFSEASTLLFKRGELEGMDFAPNFPKLSGRVRAVFALSEGNPRYLVLLYNILRKERFENLKIDFCSILDGLTGVLDSEIERQLSPKQKPVLKALCKCGGRGTVKDVIREYFLPDFKPDAKQEKEIGNDLSSLLETDFVEAAEDAKGRLKVYEITPPLFQLWFEMRHLNRSHHVILLEIFEKYYKLPFEEVSTAYHTLLSDIRLKPETVTERASDFLLYSHLAEKGSEHLLDLMEVTRSVYDSEKKGDYVNLLRDFEKQFQYMGNKEKAFQNRFIQIYDKFLAGKFEEAENEAEKLLEEIKGADISFIEAGALLLLAAIGIKQENHELAIDSCEKALNVAQKLELTYSQRLLGDIHYTQGKAYELQGYHEQAISYFEKALEYHRKSERMREQALDLENIGASYGNRDDHEKASQYFQESLELWNQLKDKKGILHCLFNLSLALFFSGKLNEAIEKWKQTIDLSREIGEKKIESVALLDLGGALVAKGDYKRSIKVSEQAISLSREMGDKRNEADSLVNLGAALGKNRDYEGSIKANEEAIALSRETGCKKTEADALRNLGTALRDKGDYDRSIKASEEAIALSREIGNKGTEADALLNLGAALIYKGDYKRSIESSEMAIALSRDMGDKKTELKALGNLVEALRRKGDYEGLIKASEEAVALSREVGDKRSESKALLDIGATLIYKDDYKRSIEASKMSISLSREIGDKKTELNSLFNLGLALSREGDYEGSSKASEDAITLSREIRDKKTELDSSINLGEALRKKGDYEGSIKANEEAIALSREIGHKGTEAYALLNLGAALIYKGDYKRSIESSEMAIALSRDMGDKKTELKALGNLGEALRRKGDYEGSIKASEEAITLSREIGDKRIEAGALGNLGAALGSKGDYEGAISASEKAIDLSHEIGDKETERGALRNCFRAHLENSRELVISSKPAKAVQELESVSDSLEGVYSPEETIQFLHELLFLPLLSKGFFKESLSLKEAVERWNIQNLSGYLAVLSSVIEELIEPDKRAISALPPVNRSVANEVIRQIKGKKTVKFATELISLKKYAEALETLEELYKDTPDDLYVVRNVRNAAIGAKQLSKAEIYCKKAMDLSERNPVDVGYWGVFLKEKGDIESGEKELIEAISKGSDIVFHYGVLCDIYEKQKRFYEASDIMQRALKNLELNYNEQTDFRLNLCEYLIMLNKTGEAIETFKQIDFEKIAPPQKTNYLFQKYLLSCIQSDQNAASGALNDFCDLLMQHRERACSIYDFTTLIQYAADNLGERQITLLRKWADAAKGIISISEFIQIYGTEEQQERAAKEWNDDRSIAIHHLKSGKIKNLDDITKFSTGSNPIETALDAYSYFYNDLSEEIQSLSRGLIIEGLTYDNPSVNKTAAQSAGALFWKFSPKEKEKALSGLLLIAQKSDAPLDLRDAALSVIAALFFQLTPSQQDRILPVLREVEKEYSPGYLKQLVSRIDQKEEEKS